MLFREPATGRPKSSSKGNQMKWDKYNGCWKEMAKHRGDKRLASNVHVPTPNTAAEYASHKRAKTRDQLVKKATEEYNNHIAQGQEDADLAGLLESRIASRVHANLVRYHSSRCFQCVACSRPDCGRCAWCLAGKSANSKKCCRERLCLDPVVEGEDGKAVRVVREEDDEDDEVMSLSDVEEMQTSDVEEGEACEEEEEGEMEREKSEKEEGKGGVEDRREMLEVSMEDDDSDEDILGGMDEVGGAEEFLRMRQANEVNAFADGEGDEEEDDNEDGEEDEGPAWTAP